MSSMKKWIVLLVITIIWTRFQGINWDQNSHLHPDERFLTMVTQKVALPSKFVQYLDTTSSAFNPNNVGFGFYVYGTFPILVVKIISNSLNLTSYNDITIVGRYISAILDTGVVFLVYVISYNIFRKKIVGIFSSLVYCLMVLPIQLAHFFTVEPYMVFFITLSIYWLISLIKKPVHAHFYSLLLGCSIGLAISSKISAALFLPVVLLGYIYFLKKVTLSRSFVSALVMLISLYFSTRLAQPYLFSSPNILNPSLNIKLIENWKQLESWNKPDTIYPPAILWTNTPTSFSSENLFLWGLGVPLTIISLGSLCYSLTRWKSFPLFALSSWSLSYFVYQSLQFSRPMRYMVPIFPILAILSGLIMLQLKRKYPSYIFVVIIVSLFIWPTAFTSIYLHTNTRVAASEWIKTYVPPGSTLSCDYWDDCLPLTGSEKFHIQELHPYDPDSTLKITALNESLNNVDFLVISSNRLYGSITSVPKRYPQTSMFYHQLFSGNLGFVKIAEFSSRPNLPVPFTRLCLTPPLVWYGAIAKIDQRCDQSGISLVDDYAEESFTVYDHPKVIIFQKINNRSTSLQPIY